MKMAQRAIAASLFTGLLVVAAGCGGGDKKSHLAGLVTYNNAPVTGGNLNVTNDSGGSFSCAIQMDGNYVITDIPPGTYSVTVDTESVNPDRKTPAYGSPQKMGPGAGTAAKMEKMNKEYESMMKKGGEAGSPDAGGSFGPASKEELLKRYTKIPAKYTDKKTSGLTVEVGQGKIKKDFVLAD